MANIREVEEVSVREGEILKLVVSNYISNSSPVSSLYITQNYQIGLSSATVRSVFVDLEQRGFLFSPHRSAGRIPTEKGYRYYTRHMASERMLPEEEQRYIQSEYLKRGFKAEQILDATSKILSSLSNCAGVVIGPAREKTVLKHIELIDMGEEELLIILVTRSGMVYSKTLYLEDRIPAGYLRKISSHLNSVFKGCDLEEVRMRLQEEEIPSLGDANEEPARYIPMIARTIAANFASVHGTEEVYKCGIDKFFDVMSQERLRPMELGRLFESEALLKTIFRRTRDLGDLVVYINGDEDKRLAGVSVVSAAYKMGERRIGSLGVVGPNRMDYVHVVSLVDFVSRLISSMLTKISN